MVQWLPWGSIHGPSCPAGFPGSDPVRPHPSDRELVEYGSIQWTGGAHFVQFPPPCPGPPSTALPTNHRQARIDPHSESVLPAAPRRTSYCWYFALPPDAWQLQCPIKASWKLVNSPRRLALHVIDKENYIIHPWANSCHSLT